ncbi:hypothetical protein C6Y14_09120 [Streptomyces dioscori]|uniref:Carboxypeptidase regulatory-like domain-containing protein n=1 Tax=Streptomyces dioscori TaxID=2109333 RepID=A0A2P8QBY5_9ACTN|nr:hypothetical protein [Streptomyces dioscori]PSM43767.1 hypothetical protein C6Y14_09120 [Streptomyces dioscori]
MGSLRLALCAGAAAAAALAPMAYAPSVSAADGGVRVTPGSPAPGGDIRLRVQGCTGMTGTAASPAFVADARLAGAQGDLTGETRVRSTLDPGTYDIKVTCDGFEHKLKGTFTVADKKQREKQEQKEKQEREEKQRRQQKQPDGSAAASPAAPASPVAPVHAGGGGTSRLAAAEARSDGPGTRHAVVGLVLAGVAAVAVAVSSARRGRRRTD